MSLLFSNQNTVQSHLHVLAFSEDRNDLGLKHVQALASNSN